MKSIYTRGLRAVIAVLFVGLCAFALPAQAKEVKKPEFTVTLPDDWKEVPKKEMDTLNAGFRKLSRSGHGPHYDYGFQTKAAKEWLDFPYILATVSTDGRIPDEEFKKFKAVDLNREVAKRQKDMPGLLTKISVGAPVYDPSTNTVWLTTKSTVKGEGDIQGLAVMVPTRNGFIMMAAYTTQAKFAEYFPQFRRILSSVVIPKGNRY